MSEQTTDIWTISSRARERGFSIPFVVWLVHNTKVKLGLIEALNEVLSLDDETLLYFEEIYSEELQRFQKGSVL